MWAKIIIYSASRVVFAKLLYHTLRAVILHFLAEGHRHQFVAFLILFNKQSVKEGHIYLTTGWQKYVTLRHHCYPPKEIRNRPLSLRRPLLAHSAPPLCLPPPLNAIQHYIIIVVSTSLAGCKL